jgi:hypothetical protein
MKNTWSRILGVSAVVTVPAAFAAVIFNANCGGSGGMRTGAAGNSGTAGNAGQTGSAGTTGSGGTGGSGTGTGGATGTAGTGGANNSCATTMDLSCGAAALALPDGHVTNFGATEWSSMNGQYCNTDGLRGSIFGYSGGTAPLDGGPSSNGFGVDSNAGNFRLTLTAAGTMAYAGGGLAFFRCVDASAFNALRFTAFLASGDLTACNFVAQIRTFEQLPMPMGGCDPDAGVSCYDYPSAPATLTSSVQTITLPFSSFTTSRTPMSPLAGQITGLQFQFTPMGADGGEDPTPCTAEIRIDDVDFVTAP